MTDTPSPQAVSLLSDIDAEMEGRQRGYADVRGELLFRCRDFIAASPALAAETGGGAVAPRGEVTDEWADRFCEAVNWSPDGQECKAVEGEMRCATFRQIAKGHILAAIATGPEALAALTATEAKPDADRVRIAKVALEGIRLQSEDCLGVRMETITSIADHALAALKAEGK